MITPTVGRIVWFYPASNQATPGFAPPDEGQPLAAIIAGVFGDHAVHLTVFDGIGIPHSEPYVQLVQEGDDVPGAGRYATWMPYQIGKAKSELKAADTCQAIRPDPTQLRVHCLEAALRTPGVNGPRDVLAAARAYQDAIEGTVRSDQAAAT